MPTPTARDVHVNTPLTNISVAFLQSADSFVAGRVFPNVPVSKQSDRYYTYDRGEFNRDEMEKRAPGTQSAGGGYAVDNTPTYFAHVYAFHKDIDDQIRSNADSVLQLDREASQYLSHKALIKKEKTFQANYLTTGVWTKDFTPGTLWSAAMSTPIEDVRTEMTIQQQLTGFRPNTLVLTQDVLDVLVDHPDIVDRVKYGTQSQVSTVDISELRALWKIDRILVMSSIENTAAEGAAPVHAFIGAKSGLLAYSASAPGLMTPSAGYNFSWTGFFGSAGGLGTRVKKFRMDELSSDRVEIEMAFDLKVVAADMGTFLNGVIA